MGDTASSSPIGSRLRIMCARLCIWRTVPPRPTVTTEALLSRFTCEAGLPTSSTPIEAWRRVADVYVPFYEALDAIEAIEPGCVPDRADLPTPGSVCDIYQRVAPGSPWTHLSDDERIDAWTSAMRSMTARAEAFAQSALSLCNLAAFRVRAAREAWPLAATAIAHPLSDNCHRVDGEHEAKFFLVVSRTRPQGGRTVGLFNGPSDPCLLVRFDDDATVKACHIGENLPQISIPRRDGDEDGDQSQGVAHQGRTWGGFFKLACLFADAELFGPCPVVTDHNLPPSVAIGLCDERRGVYDTGGDYTRRRRCYRHDDDPWTPGKKPHYGAWLDQTLLGVVLASVPEMLAVVQWFWTANRLDHAAAKVLSTTATGAALNTIFTCLNDETRKLLAAYTMLRRVTETNSPACVCGAYLWHRRHFSGLSIESGIAEYRCVRRHRQRICVARARQLVLIFLFFFSRICALWTVRKWCARPKGPPVFVFFLFI
ncbi:hypothetical protein pneo_cds_995 [Pandoravirus neocaledonia]|uniref:DUF5848 domain-containing protein n=1 Tax=Pandoravirus neocaledonia TaxID=2107708 RepID=A0A2U7UDW7_9VIRU|nr:hypothetical protein pneo_cds_995 [Pandoravirus neocaledonia]AVK76602.1 hypothetical protein pneo_cds_995 [Pandoravirus neocaledonia]